MELFINIEFYFYIETKLSELEAKVSKNPKAYEFNKDKIMADAKSKDFNMALLKFLSFKSSQVVKYMTVLFSF